MDRGWSMDRIIGEKERRRITNVPRSTWHRWEREGRVPRRRRISGRSVGWLLSELDSWMQSLPVAGGVPATEADGAA